MEAFSAAWLREQLNKNQMVQDRLNLISLWHSARTADALERIAKHLEDGRIATLEGRDIVLQLSSIYKAIKEK